jgi:hypothetical protein
MIKILDSINYRGNNYYLFDYISDSLFFVFENKIPKRGKILVGLNKECILNKVYQEIHIF